MFEYLEPDASGAPNFPPSSRSTPQARPERVRHLLYGILAGIVRGAFPGRRIAPLKSSMPSAIPTPTIGVTPSPCHLPAKSLLQPPQRAPCQRRAES
jgi:hypothetical protein